MAEKEHKGLVARWLEGKERDEDYARRSLPTSRWGLFWDILKGRFGRLMLVNLLMLLTFLPVILLIFGRWMQILGQGATGPFASGLGVGYPVVPSVVGAAQTMVLYTDLIFYALFIPAGVIAGIGISGGAYIIRNLIWTEGIFVANDFARGIRRNFWNVLEAVLFFTVVLFIVQMMADLADLFVAADYGIKGWMIASKVVGYLFVVLALLISFWMIALGINYTQGPWALFRNAVVMTFGTFPQTVFFAAIALIPVLLALFGGGFLMAIGIIVLALFGFSYLFLVWMDYAQWAFDKFVNPNLGFAVGRGLYNGDKSKENAAAAPSADESAAAREYRRAIVAQGRSRLASRPIKPIDDDVEFYQLPESFSREDLQKLRESRKTMEDDAKAYEEEHKNDAQYVEYNREFDERERALAAETEQKGKGKSKKRKRPKLLNKN